MSETLLIVSGSLLQAHKGRYYVQGGFGRHVDAFARRFEHVYLLTCVADVEETPDDYFLQAPNVSVIRLRNKWHTNRLLRYLLFARATIETAVTLPRVITGCDLVHVRIPDAVANVGALLARLYPKPLFLYVSGDWEGAIRAKGQNPILRLLARAVQAHLRFLVNGSLCFTAGEPLARKFGGPNDTVVPVMTTAIDRTHVVSIDTARRRTEQEPTELLFVGQIWEGKGVHVLLDALQGLRAGGVDVRLRVIGRSLDDGTWLHEQIRAKGVGAVVDYQPHMAWEQLMQEYDKSDIFVLPSIALKAEGIPKVTLEAMARGVPVVASDVGGVRTLVTDQQNGMLVTPGSSEDIIQAIVRLRSDRDLRVKLVTNGIRTATQYDLDGLIDLMVDTVYDRFQLNTSSPINELKVSDRVR